MSQHFDLNLVDDQLLELQVDLAEIRSLFQIKHQKTKSKQTKPTET